MSEQRLCRNCKDVYKVHIDYTFTEYLVGYLVEALSDALENVVTCQNYKPMSNLEYLEYLEYEATRKKL
jgi:hypothetical protein